MADPLPPSPASPGAPPSPAARAPGIVQAFVGVLTRPAKFYASVREVGGFGAPVVFALVAGLVAGAISAVYALAGRGGGAIGASAIVLTPILAVIASFVGGAIVHVASIIAGGKGTFEQSVRVAGYAGAVMPLSALLGVVPVLRYLPTLYGLYLVAVGLIAVHAAERRRTYAVMGVLAAIFVLFSLTAALAGRAARQIAEEGRSSELQREVEKARSEVEKAKEELQRAADEARRQEQAPRK